MPHIELSISPDYVKGWGFRDAIRELYQNCMDQETVNPENALFFDYNPETLVLRIGNKSSTLSTATLVLGKTSKAEDERTVGQFGEGYKLALIVLLRLGKSVTIYNKPDVWTPSIKHSEVFGTAVLNIHTVKYRFKELPEQDLVFKIAGVTAEEIAQVFESNRHFHDPTEELDHNFGKILLDPRYKGQVFVKGLFVTQLDDLECGYDIKPAYLQIGRDRDLVNGWSITYKTSAMWASQSTQPELVKQLLDKKARDVNCLESHVYAMPTETVHFIGGDWYQQHGPNAVPCASQEEADQARATYGAEAKIVMVTEQMLSILKRCPQFKETSAASLATSSPFEIIGKLLDHPDKNHYKPQVRSELEAIHNMAKYWTWAK